MRILTGSSASCRSLHALSAGGQAPSPPSSQVWTWVGAACCLARPRASSNKAILTCRLSPFRAPLIPALPAPLKALLLHPPLFPHPPRLTPAMDPGHELAWQLCTAQVLSENSWTWAVMLDEHDLHCRPPLHPGVCISWSTRLMAKHGVSVHGDVH